MIDKGSFVAVALVLVLAIPHPAPAQARDPASRPDAAVVRVAQERANVHQGPTTVRIVLVQVPENTVFPVVSRQGEWLEVELSLELRETGTVIRWYENETTGWVHKSWVEPAEQGPEP